MDNFPTEHAFNLFKWLLNPSTIASITTYTSLFGLAGRWVWKKLEARQNADLANIKADVKGLADTMSENMVRIERDMLRLQIMAGINSGRLSPGEVTMLYDAYKEKGGNSYISRVVDDYLEEVLNAKHN